MALQNLKSQNLCKIQIFKPSKAPASLVAPENTDTESKYKNDILDSQGFCAHANQIKANKPMR